MTYGTIKVDTVTFTNAGVDKSVTLSGLVQNPVFSGNVTVTGTLSGVTVTGTTANFTSGNFTNISGGTHTITSGVFAAGSAASPSITFTGDLNTGIYSPGADQVAISTNSSGRLFIDANGNVGINTASTIAPGGFGYAREFALTGATSGDSSAAINIRGSRTISGGFGDINFWHQSTSNRAYIQARRGSSDSAIDLDFITSGGAGMRITSAGLVGVGVSNPSGLLTLGWNSSTGINAGLIGQVNNSAGANNGYRIGLRTSSDASNWCSIDQAFNNLGTDASTYIAFTTTAGYTAAERMRLTSTGLGIGTSSPASLLNIKGSAANGFSLTHSNNTVISELYELSGAQGAGLSLKNSSGTTNVFFNAGGDSYINGGKVGIGTTTPSQLLHLNSATAVNTYTLYQNPNTQTYIGITAAGDSTIYNDTANRSILFSTNGTERGRWDPSGRLLVGTSTSIDGWRQQIVDSDTQNFSVFTGRADSLGPRIGLKKSRGSTASPSVVSSGDAVGTVAFFGYDGSTYIDAATIRAEVDGTPGANDMPGRLVFSTTADGASSPTERMRLINSGFLKVSNDGSYQSATSGNHEFTNTLDSDSLVVRSTNASYSGNGILALATRNTTNNSFYAFSYYNSGASAYRFRIADSGNATNTNNSYGAISDIKLKENIVNATSQWDDIKALQVRKYNFKEETGQQTHTQIGLIAQEVELVSPGLVSESSDRDAEGNDLGTVTKSVNYSVLYMKAVKALQEAMERIETLEAKVAALESA